MPLDWMRDRYDWALAILVVAGQESLWPTGASSLKKHNRVLSEALPKGWAGCPRGQEWQLWLDLSSWTFFPWLPKEVLFPVQCNQWIMPSSPKFMRSWRRGCYILHPVHVPGVGGASFTSHDGVGNPLCLGPSGVFNSQSCPHWTSRDLFIAVQVFLPWHWFPW